MFPLDLAVACSAVVGLLLVFHLISRRPDSVNRSPTITPSVAAEAEAWLRSRSKHEGIE
jgi:hypothetical protein